MATIQQTPIGYLSPLGDFGPKNAQALAGVSGLWDDYFAQALAALVTHPDTSESDAARITRELPTAAAGATPVISDIKAQRQCDLQASELQPGRTLHLPIAEFDFDLLDKPNPPFDSESLVAQQHELEIDTQWRRPVVLKAYAGLPALLGEQAPRKMKLPIAEFDLDLLDQPAFQAYDDEALAAQQEELDYDHHWVAPIVTGGVRLAA